MRLVLERLPESTVISVGHRAELEAFHNRKLVLEYHAEGARLVGDESGEWKFRRPAKILSRLLDPETPPPPLASDVADGLISAVGRSASPISVAVTRIRSVPHRSPPSNP